MVNAGVLMAMVFLTVNAHDATLDQLLILAVSAKPVLLATSQISLTHNA